MSTPLTTGKSMSRSTRQIIVAHLTDRGMNPADIASELGVSKETVRRDLLNTPQAESPEPVSDVAPNVAADKAGLVLPDDPQLGPDLRLLAASYRGSAEDVVRHLLRCEAEAIRARISARFAAEQLAEQDAR